MYGVASNNRTVSVRKILQLACFLNLSLSDLLTPPPEDNTLAEIREMYQQGISMYHIAQLYGTDRKTIAHWVKPLNTALRFLRRSRQPHRDKWLSVVVGRKYPESVAFQLGLVFCLYPRIAALQHFLFPLISVGNHEGLIIQLQLQYRITKFRFFNFLTARLTVGTDTLASSAITVSGLL